jgi:hypothetical protein
MHYATAAALFNVTNLDATTIQGMPSIIDFNFLPDMGRMSANWRSVARTGYLPEVCAPAYAPLPS